MTYLSFDEKNGKLKALQVLPTLPDTYTGEGQASASLLSKNGEILIGSNRIHESIVLYRIDQNTGYMKELGYYPTLGLTPRFISFNRDYSLFMLAMRNSEYHRRRCVSARKQAAWNTRDGSSTPRVRSALHFDRRLL